MVIDILPGLVLQAFVLFVCLKTVYLLHLRHLYPVSLIFLVQSNDIMYTKLIYITNQNFHESVELNN